MLLRSLLVLAPPTAGDESSSWEELLGGYILAGELTANPEDPAAAFAEYQNKFQGFVKDEGSIPLGGNAPKIFEPQSRLGVWTLRSIFWAITRIDLPRAIEYLPKLPDGGSTEKKFELPEYSI